MERCKVYKRCSGCQLTNMDYGEQLAYKQRQLNSLLEEFGSVEKIVSMENPYHYRNKAQAAFYFDFKHRRCASGIYQGTTKRIVPVESCQLEDEESDEIIQTVRALADSFKLKPYDMRYECGFLRSVLIRKGFATGEIMVVIVSFTPVFPSKKAFVKELLKKHPNITTVVHNVNDTQTNLMLGERSYVLYGKGYIEDILCGCRFRISPASFYQINPVQCEKLYNTALDFAQLTGNETVFDSYCGTGTIGIIASKSAKRVIGAEINRSAINDAVENAKLNGAKNVFFECADAGEFIKRTSERFDVVIMDPPRAGSTKKFMSAVCKNEPKKIIYISCNPVTLARDLKFLTNNGYAATKIQPFDMFPHTKHIETAVCLENKIMR